MKNRNLFVGNLGPNITQDELREQFSYFGRVRFIRFLKEKGIAFVRMARAEGAYNARLGLNGVQLNGHRIRVLEARPKNRQNPSARGAYMLRKSLVSIFIRLRVRARHHKKLL